MTKANTASSLRAWYGASISDFLQSQPDSVLGRLTASCDFALIPTQRDAWIQGLELDWTCVTWDGDFRFTDSGWSYHDFRGDSWTNISNKDNRIYLRNAYRVLLTRARQGMVIFVPAGESTDPTRARSFYHSTFNYLTDLGIPVLA